MYVIWKITHFKYDYVCWFSVYLNTTRNHIIIIGFRFQEKNFSFHQKLCLRIAAVVFKFYQVMISTCQQGWVHTLGRYETTTLTHNLVFCRHIIEFWWKDLFQHEVADDNNFFIPHLFHTTQSCSNNNYVVSIIWQKNEIIY